MCIRDRYQLTDELFRISVFLREDAEIAAREEQEMFGEAGEAEPHYFDDEIEE